MVSIKRGNFLLELDTACYRCSYISLKCTYRYYQILAANNLLLIFKCIPVPYYCLSLSLCALRHRLEEERQKQLAEERQRQLLEERQRQLAEEHQRQLEERQRLLIEEARRQEAETKARLEAQRRAELEAQRRAELEAQRRAEEEQLQRLREEQERQRRREGECLLLSYLSLVHTGALYVYVGLLNF